MVDPITQAVERALAMTDEEHLKHIADGCDRIPEHRLIDLITAHMES